MVQRRNNRIKLHQVPAFGVALTSGEPLLVPRKGWGLPTAPLQTILITDWFLSRRKAGTGTSHAPHCLLSISWQHQAVLYSPKWQNLASFTVLVCEPLCCCSVSKGTSRDTGAELTLGSLRDEGHSNGVFWGQSNSWRFSLNTYISMWAYMFHCLFFMSLPTQEFLLSTYKLLFPPLNTHFSWFSVSTTLQPPSWI